MENYDCTITTLDASVSYSFAKASSVRLQGRNLTNERARFSGGQQSAEPGE